MAKNGGRGRNGGGKGRGNGGKSGPRWQKESMELAPNHNWKAAPGHNVFVVDRGAVQFEIPQDWVLGKETDAVTLYNRAQPDDDCRLQLTILYGPPDIDYSDLLLGPMLEQATAASNPESGPLLGSGPVIEEVRPHLELAWRERRFLDPGENREARSRAAIARRRGVHPFFTFDYWPEDTPWCVPVWEHIMRTLRVGNYIADPTRGPVSNE